MFAGKACIDPIGGLTLFRFGLHDGALGQRDGKHTVWVYALCPLGRALLSTPLPTTLAMSSREGCPKGSDFGCSESLGIRCDAYGNTRPRGKGRLVV
jgi:hypothetical protein